MVRGHVRIAIACAEFNAEITQAMLADARKRADELGVEVFAVAGVPGTFDLPLIVQALLQKPEVDGVVAIGAVVAGETDHDDLIAHAVAQALTGLALKFEKPIGLGITGPGQTWAQAEARVDRAGVAVESIVKQLQSLRELKS